MRIIPVMRYIFLIVVLSLGLTACQSLDLRRDARKLEQTLSTYATAVRWQPLASSYAFLDPKIQPETLPDGLGNIRVTGYEVNAAPRQLAEDRVTQSVLIEYVLIDQQAVRSLVDQQLWVRSDKGVWQRANPIPEFH